ncbi:hypothetical protein F8S13_24200 [Chloroflexia bacterium SDU3-3]|nr:hypothetical protein F8S13_24200 [Chloroflexia bacterium SDU3-3]
MTSPHYSASHLLALAAWLMPNNAKMVEDMQEICNAHAEQQILLASEQADEINPWDIIDPWVSLTRQLESHKQIAIFDWKTTPEDLRWLLDSIGISERTTATFWEWHRPDEWRCFFAREQLQAVGKHLRAYGYALAYFETDDVAVMIVPLEHAPKLVELAQKSGYGRVEIWG